MALQLDFLAQVIDRVRQREPVVHAITNWITAGDVANALRAIGARPIMAVFQEEIEDVTSKADALVLNLGTPDPSRVNAMVLAGKKANDLGRPVIFDPVGAGASLFRMEATRRILSEIQMTAIRGNQAEIGFLTETGGESRGVDAIRGPVDLKASGRSLSQKTGAVVVLSGPEDFVVRNENVWVVGNGDPMMGQLMGTGCMLAAVMGAFAAVERDPFVAAAGAVVFFGLAGERAALGAKGPGTFRAALLDALFTLRPEDVKVGAKIKSNGPSF